MKPYSSALIAISILVPLIILDVAKAEATKEVSEISSHFRGGRPSDVGGPGRAPSIPSGSR